MEHYLILLLSVLATSIQAHDDCSWITSRSRWGGRPSKSVEYMKIPVEYVIIQHTATPECSTLSDCADSVVNIQNYQMNELGWNDIGFSFLVGGDGNVYEGTGWHQVGAHTIGYNTKSVGITLIGNFNDVLPPLAQLNATRRLLDCGVTTGRLADDFKLLGHRQVSATISPGLALYQEIQNWPEWVEKP